MNSVHYYRNERESVVVEGLISADPDRRREKVNYTVDIDNICFQNNCRKVHGRILASYPLYPVFEYNQRIRLTGRLVEPPEFEDFSYKDYLSLLGVYSIMQRPFIVTLSEPSFSVKGMLFKLKDAFEFQLNVLFPRTVRQF